MGKAKYGSKRPIADRAKIGLLTNTGVEYSTMGYASDLQFYQGPDSIFKAERIARTMRKDRGDELITLVKDSNARMETMED